MLTIIQLYIDGEWLKAKDTTLGADDGIGVALCLALLSDEKVEHGPIEALFTGMAVSTLYAHRGQLMKKLPWVVLKTSTEIF